MLTIRQAKFAMVVAATLLAVCGAGVLAWGLTAPVEVPVPSDATKPRPVPIDGDGGAGADTSQAKANPLTPPLAQLVRSSLVKLRRPLYDPPPPPAPTIKPFTADMVKPKPGPSANPQPVTMSLPGSLKLIGTAIEHGRTFAIFSLTEGRYKVCGVGEGFEMLNRQLTVKAIDGRKVSVEFADRKYEVEVPAPRRDLTQP